MTKRSTDILTTEQAGDLLGVSAAYVQRLCREGKLGRRFNRNWLITRAELDAFQQTRRKRGRPRKSN